jgi:hypothetical protein
MLLGGGFLVYRASTAGMGQVYVRAVEVDPEGDAAGWTNEVAVQPNQRSEPDVRLSWSRTIGLWIAAFFTFAIFSFLWGDNAIYKFAEAVFIGSSAGYAMVIGFWDGIIVLLFRRLTPGLMRDSFLPSVPDDATISWWFLVPLVFGLMMLWRLAPTGGWISRWALAFFIGATAGLRLIAYFESDFVEQIRSTIMPLVVMAPTWQVTLGHTLKNLTVLAGILTCIVYFFFSVEHKGVVGRVARVGIWFLMITFGAGFGYTVMGRIALLSGRFEFLFDDWLWIIDPVGKRLGM